MCKCKTRRRNLAAVRRNSNHTHTSILSVLDTVKPSCALPHTRCGHERAAEQVERERFVALVQRHDAPVVQHPCLHMEAAIIMVRSGWVVARRVWQTSIIPIRLETS